MSVELGVEDLRAFVPDIDEVKAEAMIEDAIAQASLVAPCILGDDLAPEKVRAARAILRGAILRWEATGAGGVTTQHTSTAGPITEAMTMTTGARRSMFWPTEIRDLRNLCGRSSGAAFSIDTLPPREESV